MDISLSRIIRSMRYGPVLGLLIGTLLLTACGGSAPLSANEAADATVQAENAEILSTIGNAAHDSTMPHEATDTSKCVTAVNLLAEEGQNALANGGHLVWGNATIGKAGEKQLESSIPYPIGFSYTGIPDTVLKQMYNQGWTVDMDGVSHLLPPQCRNVEFVEPLRTFVFGDMPTAVPSSETPLPMRPVGSP